VGEILWQAFANPHVHSYSRPAAKKENNHVTDNCKTAEDKIISIYWQADLSTRPDKIHIM